MNHSIHLKLVLGAVAVFLVLAALGVPVFSNLPLLGILVICPLMMMFMMRSMSHGGSRDDQAGKTDDAKDSAQVR
jgi:hypothetical protein